MVPDTLEFFRPVTVRKDRTADTLIVVTRRRLNHLLERRELLDAELLETDGIKPDLLGELRDVEHFFFGLADVAVDEVPVQIEIILRQDRKRRPGPAAE